MTAAPEPDRGYLELSRGFLEVLGADGIGDEYDLAASAVDGIEPRWLLMPATVEECSRVLAVATEHRLAVVPAGFGARLGEGAPPERLDVVLSVRRLDRVVEHAAADLTLTVEAGASLAVLGERLRLEGQWLPFDPPFASATSIGGLIATQAAGPVRQAFGTVRESVIGLRAVLADGTVVKSGGRVVKNVAGYDLHRLLCGSFGTLAVVVEASFKLRPLPEKRAEFAFAAPAAAPLVDVAQAIAASSIVPSFLELVARDGDLVLVVGLAGLREEIDEARGRLAAITALPEVALRTGEVERSLEETARPIDRGRSAIVMRLGLPPARLAPRIDRLLERARRIAARARIHAHAGVGVARLRLEDVAEPDASQLLQEARTDAEGAGGYLVVESAPAEWKSRIDPWGSPPPTLDLMKRVKSAFDPARVLSPGRYVGGI